MTLQWTLESLVLFSICFSLLNIEILWQKHEEESHKYLLTLNKNWWAPLKAVQVPLLTLSVLCRTCCIFSLEFSLCDVITTVYLLISHYQLSPRWSQHRIFQFRFFNLLRPNNMPTPPPVRVVYRSTHVWDDVANAVSLWQNYRHLGTYNRSFLSMEAIKARNAPTREICLYSIRELASAI